MKGTDANVRKTDANEGYQSRASYAMARRFIFTHQQRTPLKSILSIAPAVVFLIVLSFIQMQIANNEREAVRLYTMIQIDAELEQADSVLLPTVDIMVHRETADYLLKSGYFQNMLVKLDAPQNQSLWVEGKCLASDLPMYGIMHARPLPLDWKKAVFTYAPGWDTSCFERSYDGQEERMPVFLSDAMLALTGLKPGDEAQLTGAGFVWEDTLLLPDDKPPIQAVVAGSFSIGQGPVGSVNEWRTAVLFPFSGVECFGSLKGYAAAEFVIDPSYNSTLDALSDSVGLKVLINHGGAPLRLVIWDEEIRAVIKPMERTLSLLKILYPVIAVAAAGVAVAMAYLMVLQDAVNGAILRILGVDRRRALWIQAAKQWIPCIAGLVIGLAAGLVLMRGPEAKDILLLPLWAGLYFAGCAAGSLAAGISTTARTPLYLLQTRE